MEEHDQENALRKDRLRKKIAAGMASLRAGKSVDGEAFFAKIDAELAELERREAV
jgi:antitoxin ParD1/3/4